MKESFVHLHVHTNYSWDGACTCSDIAEQTRKLGMNSVAITDHSYLHGAIGFYEECKRNGIKPIIGCEFYVKPDRIGTKDREDPFQLILLAENEAGYRNLVRLASSAATKGLNEAPSIEHNELQKLAKGLIGIFSCLNGEITAPILNGDVRKTENRVLFYKELFGKDNFFLEICPSNNPDQILVNKSIVDISEKCDVPLVATNNVYYLRHEDAELHHILVGIRKNSTLNEMYYERFKEENEYLRSPEEMWALFGKELPQSLLNTLRIADRCQVDLETDVIYLPNFPLSGNDTLETYLDGIAKEGLSERLKTKEPSEEYLKRLHYELKTIEKAGLSGYFCVLADIIDAAKEMSVQTGPRRGLSSGSLLAWSLGITKIDPIKYGLLFELFLDPTRISMPSVGIEVSDKEREDIFSYIEGKYGSNKVARIVGFNSISNSEAVADVARVIEMTSADVHRVLKLLPDTLYPPAIYLISDCVENIPDLKTLYESDAKTAKLLDLAERIEWVTQRCYEHVAGIVITPEPVADMVPVRKFDSQRILTQYHANHLDKLGLVRIDLLGIKELSVIEDTLTAVVANGKDTIVLDDIPLNDSKTFEMIRDGNTNGVFPNEWSGIEDLIKRMKPDRFEDLIALTALYRPGPLESGLTDRYILCKHNKKPVNYLHPALVDLTKETYGLLLYHEQLVQSIALLTGWSIEEANRLRRKLSIYRTKVLAEYRERFIADASKNSICSKDAEELFEIFEISGGYCFSKAYSTGFALSIYRSAWLKANYRTEFLQARLSRGIFDECAKSIS